jgi:predicted ATPase
MKTMGSPRRLKRLAVRGFKSIASLDLDQLGRVTVLLGPNGAGKSNLLQALRLLGRMNAGLLGRSVADAGGANALLYRGARHTQKLELEADFEQEDKIYRYVAQLRFVAGDRLVFANELCGDRALDGARAGLGSIGLDHTESRLAEPDPHRPELSLVREVIRGWLQGLGYYHFHDTSETSPLRTNARAVDDSQVQPDGSNLAAYLRTLKQSEDHDSRAAWQLLLHRIRHIAPFLQDLLPEPEGRDHVRLTWVDTRGDRYGVHQLSDGTLRALALFAALGQPLERRPRFLTIDEPELGLHPAALHAVCELIRSISSTTQVMVATQSPALLDHFQPSDVLVVEAHDEGSVLQRLDPGSLESWLDEYSLSDLFEKNVLGGRP